jgi:hypothetical protein
MINLRPTVSYRDIGGPTPCVILDDVIEDPQALIDLALRHRAAFAPAAHNAFPGPELPLPQSVVARFTECFSQHARGAVGARRVVEAHGRMSIVALPPERLSPIQRVCHRDRLAAATDECVAAAVVYLFRDELLGGTAFYAPRHPPEVVNRRMSEWAAMDGAAFERDTGWPAAYMTTSNQWFERSAVVEPRFNRMICYDGSQFHSSHIAHPQRLTDDPNQGRLTLNLFLRCKRRAQ